MAPNILQPLHCFGHSPNCGVRDTVFALLDHSYICTSGRSLTINSQAAEDGECEFLPGLEDWEKVTTVCRSRDMLYLAVCTAYYVQDMDTDDGSLRGKKTAASAHGGEHQDREFNSSIIIYKLPLANEKKNGKQQKKQKQNDAADTHTDTEDHENTAVINVEKRVQTPKKIRTLYYTPKHENTSDIFCESSFSPDGKMLYVQTSAPDYTLLLYDWGRSKLLAQLSLQVEAQRISSPQDTNISRICTCGPDHLCFWAVGIGGRDLKACDPVKGLDAAVEGREVSDCAYLYDNASGGRVVATTTGGNVLIVDEHEVIQVWRNAHDNEEITCCLPFTDGVTGAATFGDDDDVAGFITLGGEYERTNLF